MRGTKLDPDDPQVRAAVFGEQVQEFLKSEIGTYLVRRMQAELAEATEALKVVDATDSAKVMKLQVMIRTLERLAAWLGDAVQDGLTAIANIEGEEDHAEDGS